MDGPQVYGRTAADDVGFEAAFLANELGRPVRVQWMRHEETAWDTKGPAYDFKLRGGLDAQGKLTALEYDARAVDYNHLGYNEPDTVLIAQLMGRRRETPTPAMPRRRRSSTASRTNALTAHVVALPMVWETPLRTGNLRDPNGPQVTFAFEGFIDELAAAARKPIRRSSVSRCSRRAQRTTSFARRARSPSSARRSTNTAGTRGRRRNRNGARARSRPGAASPTRTAATPSSR